MKKGHSAMSQSILKCVLAGLCMASITAVAAVGGVALLILRENITTAQLTFWTPCIHFLVLFSGCLTAGFVRSEKILYSSGIILGLMYFLYCATTILAFDGKFASVILHISMGVLGALCAVLIHIRRSGGGNRRFRRRKIC